MMQEKKAPEELRPEGIASSADLAYCGSLEGLKRACAEGVILQARCTLCDSLHNLFVSLGEIRGFIPREEAAIGIREGEVKDVAIITRVNKMISFTVTGFGEIEGEPCAILSRRAAQERCLNWIGENVKPGDILSVRVTHLEQFGAFVDVGCGVPSMIPIDRISVSRIRHPDHRFSCGMTIRAVVLQLEENRILLSHKELLGTWLENTACFEAGQTVSGIIRSVENYGVFIELAPNLAGLAELTENAEPDTNVSVYIKSIIPEKMKIKLVIVEIGDKVKGATPFRYFYEKDHMDQWTYSPPECNRRMEEVF